jgi:hypothetical protein
VKKWHEEQYPVIAACAKVEGAEIHWGDETGLRSDDVRGRSYAPQGQTPVVRVNSKRHGLSVMSTVTNKGTMRWKIFDGALNSDILIDFLKRLVRDAGRKVYLILDNLRVHHSKPVKAWLAEHKHEIEVFYLPSYSPELNPDEDGQCRLEAGRHQARAGSHEAAIGQGNIQASAQRAEAARTDQALLRSCTGSVCSLSSLFQCRLNSYWQVVGLAWHLASRLAWKIRSASAFSAAACVASFGDKVDPAALSAFSAPPTPVVLL